MNHVNLSAESMARILQFGNAQPCPAEREAGVLRGDAREERMRAVEVGAGAGAHHECAEQGAPLQILFAHRAGQRTAANGSRSLRGWRFNAVGSTQSMQRSENLIGNLG